MSELGQHFDDYTNGKITTTDGRFPKAFDEALGAPAPINPATGMHEAYWVLSESERAKGFVRPVRNSYAHVGPPGPRHPVRDLTAKEIELWGDEGYVKFEEYPEPRESSAVGRFWTQAQLDKVGKGCGSVTRMGAALAETYAANPGYYGSTFCCACRTHLRVGRDGEFVWEGTADRVGT